MDNKNKLPTKNELCYGCYVPISSDHNARNCKHRGIYTICKQKYPTGLHGYKHPINRKLIYDSTNANDNSMTCATTQIDCIC